MITVVDQDAGNISSIVNICHKAGGQAQISRDPEKIAAATKLILPGIGHFGRIMRQLIDNGIAAALNEAVIVRKVPILGICLGMQLFSQHSEEGDATGFGWIPAQVVRFKAEGNISLKIPHMGWNTIDIVRSDPLLDRLPEESRFYFVHSYHVVCNNVTDIIAWTSHGAPFVSAIGHANIWGTQFHPEKSHKYGLAVVRNFVHSVTPC